MAVRWLELFVQADGAAQDILSSFLVEQGSTGVVCGDRSLRAYFPDAVAADALRDAVRRYLRGLREVLPDSFVGRVRWRVVADRDWNGSWRARFRPRRVGRRLLVTPPWRRPRDRRRHVIFIEPAMAFGAGGHETTRCCLELIDEVCAAVAPAAALDVGAGSGILAIAMARLGVGRVLALDNDPTALEAARINLGLNRVAAAVTLSGMPLGRVRRRFPLVAANLILETLVDLSIPLSRRVAAGGSLILSGLLREHVPAVMPHFGALRMVQRRDRGEWSTLLLRRDP